MDPYTWTLFVALSLSPMDRPVIIDVPTDRDTCILAEHAFKNRVQERIKLGYVPLSSVQCYGVRKTAPGKTDLERLP